MNPILGSFVGGVLFGCGMILAAFLMKALLHISWCMG